MTQQEYFAELDRVSEFLQEEKLDCADKKLQELYEYKPVRLKWFVRKAELMAKRNCIQAANQLLKGKFFPQYSYSGIEDVYRYYEQLWKNRNNIDDYLRNRYYIESLLQASGKTYDHQFIDNRDTKLKQVLKQYNEGNKEIIELLVRESYYTQNIVLYKMADSYCMQIHGKKVITEEWVKDVNNMGYLEERLENKKEETFIIIESPDVENIQFLVVKKLLEELGKRVIYIVLTNDFKSAQEEILREALCKRNGELATLIATGTVLKELSMCPMLDKYFSVFDIGTPDFFDCMLGVAWVGNYLSYIGKIYNCDIGKSLKEKSICRYSIVIPVRNSATTLQYTLKTCLEIPYDSFEIIISDNSTNNNAAVYELCQQFGDARIKYVRTPRDLRLSRSFEYAILQARGEFIIPIGSDDGVLPWIFETLDVVRQQYPNEYVVQWERGFYAWSEFNDGQQNQFVMPRKYEKDNYNIYYRTRENYLSCVLTNPKEMYDLPFIYINSGFKREYLDELLNKTGRLWDGICQDIYMGIINVALNDKILNLKYPLTIAGMSSGSEGAKANSGLNTLQASKQFNDEMRKSENVGGFSLSYIERFLPELRTDISSLFNSCLRAVDRGVLPKVYMDEVFDWKMMMLQCMVYMDVCDVEFDRKLHYARYVASWHGEEFLKWFDENLYNVLLEPNKQTTAQEKVINERNYVIGTNEDGGVTLDASEYDVSNVYEAVGLFCAMLREEVDCTQIKGGKYV